MLYWGVDLITFHVFFPGYAENLGWFTENLLYWWFLLLLGNNCMTHSLKGISPSSSLSQSFSMENKYFLILFKSLHKHYFKTHLTALLPTTFAPLLGTPMRRFCSCHCWEMIIQWENKMLMTTQEGSSTSLFQGLC